MENIALKCRAFILKNLLWNSLQLVYGILTTNKFAISNNELKDELSMITLVGCEFKIRLVAEFADISLTDIKSTVARVEFDSVDLFNAIYKMGAIKNKRIIGPEHFAGHLQGILVMYSTEVSTEIFGIINKFIPREAKSYSSLETFALDIVSDIEVLLAKATIGNDKIEKLYVFLLLVCLMKFEIKISSFSNSKRRNVFFKSKVLSYIKSVEMYFTKSQFQLLCEMLGLSDYVAYDVYPAQTLLFASKKLGDYSIQERFALAMAAAYHGKI